MNTQNPFKKGDRVRRIKNGELGTVIEAVRITEDQFTTKRRGYNHYKNVQTAAKGDWKIGVHWDWEKEKYGDEVPKVTDPQFAQITQAWQWHKRHQRWILARFLEKITEEVTDA